MASLQEQLRAFEYKAERLQSELTSTQDEFRVAREDVKRFAKQSMEHWELYQKELVQHGKSVEGCIRTQDEVCVYTMLVTVYVIAMCLCMMSLLCVYV